MGKGKRLVPAAVSLVGLLGLWLAGTCPGAVTQTPSVTKGGGGVRRLGASPVPPTWGR